MPRVECRMVVGTPLLSVEDTKEYAQRICPALNGAQGRGYNADFSRNAFSIDPGTNALTSPPSRAISFTIRELR